MAIPQGIKIEEIPVIAKMLYNSFNRDKADFSDFSEEVFTDLYFTAFLAKITNVENLTGLLEYWAQSGRITQNLYATVEILRPKLNKAEAYIKLARKEVSIDPDKFGLLELRKEMKDGNVEGVKSKLEILLRNIDDNMTVLRAKGLKTELLSEIGVLKTSITTLNEQQALKDTEKNEAIKNNWKIIEELWDIAQEVLDVGKGLYRVENKERAKDYSVNNLKKRVNSVKKGEEVVTLVDKGILHIRVVNKNTEEVMGDVNFEVKETGYADVTDEDGEGQLDLNVGNYTLKFWMDRFMPLELLNIIINKDETTELEVKLQVLPDEA